jgi:hypothetical protein
MSDKINLVSNEENELCFQLVIEGTTTNDSLDKPIMRFQIEESSADGMAFTFPVNKNSDGSLKVLIPRLEHIIKEERAYKGSLEVIIGGQYFVPQTVDINFTKPLKVESKVVSVNKTATELSESPSRPRVTAKLSTPTQKPAPAKQTQPSKPAQKKLSDYTPEQQNKIRQEMLRRKNLQEQSQALKQKSVIKSLLSDALDDFDLDDDD